MQQHCVYLAPSPPPRFEPALKRDMNVFFDECNRHVFVVKDGDFDTEVSVVGFNKAQNMRLRIRNKGPVVSIKLSLDQTVLAVQCTPRMVDFFNLQEKTEFSQTCKGKSATHILGFNWTLKDEIVIITNNGVEHYMIGSDKKSLKLLKSYSVAVNWFVYSHENRVLLLSSAAQANVIHPYHFKHQTVNRLPRFDVELATMDSMTKLAPKLAEREITVGLVYGRLYCMHMKSHLSIERTDIVLYQLTRETVQRRAVLRVDARGKFALNVVDNLVLVHHQEHQRTYIFDVKLSSVDGSITYVQGTTDIVEVSVAMPPLPIAPYSLPAKPTRPPSNSVVPSEKTSSSTTIISAPAAAALPEGRPLSASTFTDNGLPVRFQDVSGKAVVRNSDAMASVSMNDTNASRSSSDVSHMESVRRWLSSISTGSESTTPTIEGKRFGDRDSSSNLALTSALVTGALVSSNLDMDVSSVSANTGTQFCEIYAHTWVVFQPNIIIDARLGCMWNVALNLEAMVPLIPDPTRLVDFLLRRAQSKTVLLNVCKTTLEQESSQKLTTAAKIFDQLNVVYRANTITEQTSAVGLPRTNISAAETDGRAISTKGWTVVDQHDMYTFVFTPLEENSKMDHKFLVAVLIEYIRSLTFHRLNVQHYLYELVINLLVRHNKFYQLHQFLQYHVVNDSKHVACLLLSLEGTYPPAYQLALDMLKRLKDANEQILEVLLSKKQLLSALRFVRSQSMELMVPAKMFLEAAASTDDNMLFFTVYKFFQARNMRTRKTTSFRPEEMCDEFVQRYESLFSKLAEVPSNNFPQKQ